MTKESKFYKALQDVFIGAKIEGEGGFINLMRIKSNYYSQIEKLLKEDINKALEKYPKFREELFDKLYSFFSRYFTESGSIYFNSTPLHNNVYEKVYTNEKDVVLFWKTQMLYYIKTDRIFKSMPVEFEDLKFYFDASQIENKKANEKRALCFELKKVRDDKTIDFIVKHSERGAKTKNNEILKELKNKNIKITEEQLEKVFRVFEKQSEVDFFINKNAKDFLQEQFKLWSYQYFWDGAKDWSSDRVNQLQILKDIAFKIIDFISQFEDELVKIWNKPKFVRNSNYVITIDRITNEEITEKILKHEGIKDQIKEWQELDIVDNDFKIKDIKDEKYKHLPIDTKYFKDLEIEILSLFDDLDNQLDGWLIKSENYQALNTILPKFKEKVQTIYIDPPFNTGSDFYYTDNYQDASWLSLMNDRIGKARQLLSLESGNFFLHLDMNANYLGRLLLNNIFGSDLIQNEIIWHYKSFHGQVESYFPRKHDTIIYFRNNSKAYFDLKRNEDILVEEMSDFKNWGKYIVNGNEIRGNYMPTDVRFKRNLDKWIRENGRQPNENDVVYVFKSQPYDDVWDIQYIDPKDKAEKIGYDTQKPEALLKRILEAVAKKKDLIMDFFIGSGTTLSVAHKLNMKWVGVEISEAFYETYDTIKTFKKKRKNDFEILATIKESQSDITAIVRLIGCLGRMKRTVSGHECGISDKVDYSGGGFFKYYELEQYEEALNNCKYNDGDLFNSPSKTPYQEYVFMKDEKMLKALEIDYKNKKVKIDLSKLYPDIDIAETLSNLTGKWIKTIKDGEVEFTDGSKINTKELDYKLIKPLIWWE
ncbi:MAG TPA: site-specific DNA-methyltransferase [bacterium]|jgi:adenine specific DNA methylase Mod|nr:site-specific DNA-methyltransferase [bacterium]HOG38497.1 site-specific DNA-methyltransferase [bacterium]